jgi:hypothetical protein
LELKQAGGSKAEEKEEGEEEEDDDERERKKERKKEKEELRYNQSINQFGCNKFDQILSILSRLDSVLIYINRFKFFL